MHQINAAQYTVSGDKQIMAKLCHKYFSDVLRQSQYILPEFCITPIA